MLMIRFQRIGRKNDPAFRIAVLEKSSGPKAGSYVDLVGTYNPKTKAVTLKPEAIRDWVAKGAQLSPSVHNLLVSQGAIEGVKTARVVSKTNLEKNVQKQLEAKKAEEEAAAAKAEADARAAEEAKVAEAAVATTAGEETSVEETPAAEEAAPAAEESVEEAVAEPEPVA